MTSTLIDTNVLLDLITETEDWHRWSSDVSRVCADEGGLVVNPVIYSETAARYDSPSLFDGFLDEAGIARVSLPWMAAFLAGRAHLDYRQRGGQRERTLPDFFIGAHALVQGYRLLTRDGARYASYFPALELMTPDTHP